jgi:hypothetical protein
VAKVDKILGYQLYQLDKNYQHQTLMIGTEMIPETLVIFNPLTLLIAHKNYNMV